MAFQLPDKPHVLTLPPDPASLLQYQHTHASSSKQGSSHTPASARANNHRIIEQLHTPTAAAVVAIGCCCSTAGLLLV
jgi:hypothetical protein